MCPEGHISNTYITGDSFMRYLWFLIIILISWFYCFLESRIFFLDEVEVEDEDWPDWFFDRIFRVILFGLQGLIVFICNKYNYGILMIVCYSIVFWGSAFIFEWLFRRSKQNKK